MNKLGRYFFTIFNASRYYIFVFINNINMALQRVDDPRKIISEFLQSKPLYTKVEVQEGYWNVNAFSGFPFNFYCEVCKTEHLFELSMYPQAGLNSNGRGGYNEYPYTTNHKNLLSHTQLYKGTCKYCNTYRVDFLLNVFQEVNKEKQITMFVRKIGQYPPYDIKPKKVVLDYLNDEDKDIYSKALMCISQSYGIGAYAYFRRIIENEIKRMIEDLSKDSAEIKSLYDANHQMDKLIDEIYQYLPSSLKELGDNPFKKLYGQLSVGLHALSEEECMEKSDNINILLSFVIEKISEQKGDVKHIKKILKSF